MAAKSKKVRTKKKGQLERFKAKARELGVEENPEVFQQAFRKLVKKRSKSAS